MNNNAILRNSLSNDDIIEAVFQDSSSAKGILRVGWRSGLYADI